MMELGKGYILPEADRLLGGRFRVVRLIGSGGIAAVLEVIDDRTPGARLAAKLLQPHVYDDPSHRERFRREASAMARLKHPNIVSIVHNGLDDPTHPFLAMEYVDGGSLGELIKSGMRLTVADTAVLLRSMLAGLRYAHEHDVVHRDLKPDNVLLTSGGIPKIADFGFARVLDLKLSLTPSGETVGTPMYMSPELFRGGAVDGRSDLYALGLIAFELVTGKRPFPEGSYMQVAAMHIGTDLPKLKSFSPDVPSWLVDFIETCCEKEPAHRYPSSAAAHAEISAAMVRSGFLCEEPAGRKKGFLARLLGK